MSHFEFTSVFIVCPGILNISTQIRLTQKSLMTILNKMCSVVALEAVQGRSHHSAQFPAVSEYSNLPPEQRGERAMRPTTFREVSSFWPKIALLLKFSDLNFPTKGNECCNLNVHLVPRNRAAGLAFHSLTKFPFR